MSNTELLVKPINTSSLQTLDLVSHIERQMTALRAKDWLPISSSVQKIRDTKMIPAQGSSFGSYSDHGKLRFHVGTDFYLLHRISVSWDLCMEEEHSGARR